MLAIALLSASTAAAAEKQFSFETPKIEGADVYRPGLGKYEHEIEPYIAEGIEQASTVARSVTVKVG